MTLDEFAEIIADYNLCIDRFPEGWDEDGFEDYAPLPKYLYKDGSQWESYSTLSGDEDDPNYGEFWELVFCNNDHYGEEGYDFCVIYKLEDDNNVDMRNYIGKWVAKQIVKQLKEAGYSLDDFEVDYIG